MDTIQIIVGDDLVGVAGIGAATSAEREYAARRASSAVHAAWANPQDPAPEWVKDIAIDVATRYLMNPEGTSSVTRSVDDASRTVRYERGTIPGGGFHLTDAERARLNPTIRRRVGSIRVAVPGFQP